ncbi:MAG: hypothetical protein M3R09_10880, partial [Actinomycetota bacterium]|nr:hypothetical protein [Actinomycetota bacterium]
MAYAEKRVSTAKGSKGKVTWRVKYKKPDGSYGSESGFPTKTTALEWGRRQEEAIKAGRWVDPELSGQKFGVFARKYMADRQKRGNTNAKRWDYLDDYLLPRWEHAEIRALTWYDVDTWQQSLPCE